MGFRTALPVVALISLVSLGEIQLRQRLLYADASEMEFVRANVAGILQGRVVSQSWQHRVLAPLVIAGLARLRGQLRAIEIFSDLATAAANFLLFAMVRRKGGSVRQALLVVALLGFCHLLVMYRLEYPWDGVDVLIFLGFGYWISTDRPGRSLASLAPLVIVGAINHETVLYLPAWFLIDRRDRRRTLVAVAAGALLVAAILALRRLLYVGRPDFPPDWFEPSLPVVGNHLHLLHNLGQALFDDWRRGRVFIGAGLLSAIALLVVLARRGRHRTAALWSLGVIATIFCFGYVNETRHYLVLIAFWFGYASFQAQAQPPPRSADSPVSRPTTSSAPSAHATGPGMSPRGMNVQAPVSTLAKPAPRSSPASSRRVRNLSVDRCRVDMPSSGATARYQT